MAYRESILLVGVDIMRKYLLVILIIFSLIISGLGVSSTELIDNQDIENSKINSELYVNPATKSNGIGEFGLPIPKNDVWISEIDLFDNNKETFHFTFNSPEIVEQSEFSHILVPECSYMTPGGAPIIPYRVATFTFTPGTRIKKINFEPIDINYESISKPIRPALEPVLLVNDWTNNFNPEPKMDLRIYQNNQLYPNNWFEYSTGMGLNPNNNERELFLVVHIYPARYNPENNNICYISSGDLEIIIEEPKEADVLISHSRGASDNDPSNNNRDVTYDMVVICQNNYKTEELVEFAERKTSTGVDTIVVTLTDITSERYFPKSIEHQSDEQEIIKYFIYSAVKEWDIKYALLIGDHEVIPTRITHVSEPGLNDNEAADLYYADVFESGNNYCDWDGDGDGNYAEYSNGNIDGVDLYPDVHIGRLPASSTSQLTNLLEKTINYEYTAIGQDWFNNAILCGLDTFGGGTPEGEYLSDQIAERYLDDFNVIKLYESDNTLTTQNVKTNMNEGAGFTSFSDHGLHSSWGNTFSSSDARSLNNGNKLPFVNLDACLTGEFDQGSSDCLAEEIILNPNGGGVAVVASSRIAYGSFGTSHINTASGYLNLRLYHNFDRTTQVAGELLTNAKIDYIRNVGSGSSANFKTIVEFNYFGDPSLLLGGLPTAIYNLKCEDNASSVKPGESAEYRIQIENTDIQMRSIELSTSKPPENWKVKLSESNIDLDPKHRTNITLTVTAPNDELAGTIGKIKVIASLSNIERTLSLETRTTVTRIYGVNILSNSGFSNTTGSVYPGKYVNLTFHVFNLGNGEDVFNLDLETEDLEASSWDYIFKDSPISIPAFDQRDVDVRILVPHETDARNYNLSIKAKIQGISKSKKLDLIVTVFRVYGVSLTCDNPSQATDPGVNITFKVDLINEGNHLEYYFLMIPKLPEYWSVTFQTRDEINDTIYIGPFTTIPVNIIIHIPQGTRVGDYNFTVITQCLFTNMVVSDETTLNIKVNRIYGILLTAPIPEMSSDPGDENLFYLELANLGNDFDSANIEILGKPNKWEVLIDSQFNIMLMPNGKRNIGINIIPYENTLVGEYDVSLRATLTSDNSVSDLRLKININRIYNLSMSDIDPPMNLTSGITTRLPVKITNLGNEKDSVILSIPKQIDNCEVAIKESGPISLKAFGTKELNFEIEPSKYICAGVKTIPIVATLESTQENYTFDINFNIRQFYGIEASSPKHRVVSQPGNEISFDLSIYNTGNGEDTYIVMIDGIPNDWTINFPTRYSITIQPFQNLNKTLFLNIPDDEDYHEVDMEVRIKSTGDNKTKTSLQLTVAIEKEEVIIAGMGVETFSISIIVLIIILLLITVFIVRRRSKKKESTEVVENVSMVTDYTLGSDGSRVQWEDPSSVMPAQYNPPTPMPVEEQFEIQVERPDTYRKQSSSNWLGEQQYDTQQMVGYEAGYGVTGKMQIDRYDSGTPAPEVLPFVNTRSLPPAQDEFVYNLPPPQTQETTTMSPEEEDALLKQLDEEIIADIALAEAEAGGTAATTSGTDIDFKGEDDEQVGEEIPEFHGEDEFSLSFKHPKVSSASKMDHETSENQG